MEDSLKGLNIDWSQFQVTPELVDQMIKLNCLQMAVDWSSTDPVRAAKEMYEWVKQPAAEKWNIVSEEVKYSYDLTGCAGFDKTVAPEK